MNVARATGRERVKCRNSRHGAPAPRTRRTTRPAYPSGPSTDSTASTIADAEMP